MSRFAFSDAARDRLETWSPRARATLDELLDDAGSDLQRELLARAVGAGHTPSEVHAFADELRGLSDEAAFAACTLDEAAPHDFTVAQLLTAEADPLFAFELKGGQLSPAEEEAPPPAAPLPAKAKPAAAPFDSRSKLSPVGVPEWTRPLPSVPPPPVALPVSKVDPKGPESKLLEDLVNEATRSLNVAWREFELDVDGGLSLEEALKSALTSVSRGLPVPCAIGPRPGDSRRLVLMLQLTTSGATRAWHLYDPLSAELVWVNEGDLLARADLPFVNKANRRLTRILLPTQKGGAFVP